MKFFSQYSSYLGSASLHQDMLAVIGLDLTAWAAEETLATQ